MKFIIVHTCNINHRLWGLISCHFIRNTWLTCISALMICTLRGQEPLTARDREPLETASLNEQIMALPVWDTHNHLAGESFKAQNFWELGHYFWFRRELEAAGYPRNAMDLPEAERAEAFMNALALTANTTWTQVFRQSMVDLFGIELNEPEDIFRINERLVETREDPDWSAKVLDRIGVKRLSIQWRARNMDNGLHEIKDRHHYYAIFNPCSDEDLGNIIRTRNATKAAEKILEEKKAELDEYLANGVRVFRFRMHVETTDQGDVMEKPGLSRREKNIWKIQQYLSHSVLEYMNDKNVHLQLFFGLGGGLMPANDHDQMQEWGPLFKKYDGITFELFTASHIQSMNMVQAARSYINVYPAGLWWLTYRRSLFLDSMQYRIEALPACRSAIVATDARRVEWVYIKTLMLKRVLVEFMEQQVVDGWLTQEQAVEAARWWLFDTVWALYEGNGEVGEIGSHSLHILHRES